MRGMKRIWLTTGACAAGLCLAAGLSAVAAQGSGAPSPGLSAPDGEAPPANRPPTVGVRGGSVRAGEGLALAAYATDMESEAVHLEASLDLHPGAAAPAWLAPGVWTAGLSAQPVLRIPVSPPADALPGTYGFLVGATDSGGLTAWRRMLLEVLPPAPPADSPSSPSNAAERPAEDVSGAASVGAAAPSSGASPATVAKSASTARPATAESPSLSLSVSPSSVSEGSSRDITVTATLTGVSMVPGMDVVGVLQVSGTATDGTDYSLSGTKSFTIPAGSATLTGTRTLRLAALADELRAEGDETVKFKVTQVTRGTEVLALSSAARATARRGFG